jgi:soluble lytic murein transglycosylase-like protein
MPGSAIARGLDAPFDPYKALRISGALLAELRDQFGPAAAAYNAGPQRVRDFLTRLRNLPQETRAYVLAIHRPPGGRLGDLPQAGKHGDKGRSAAGAPHLGRLSPLDCTA